MQVAAIADTLLAELNQLEMPGEQNRIPSGGTVATRSGIAATWLAPIAGPRETAGLCGGL